MANRSKKKEEEKGVGEKTTGEDNSGFRDGESEECPEVKVGEHGKKGRQAASPTQTANFSGDDHGKRRIGRILGGRVARGRDNIPLAEVGIKAMRMRKAMTEGIVLEISEDKRKKTAELAARLIRTLDPCKVPVAPPLRVAEARVVGIDVSAIKEKITNTLAKEGGCKVEDIQLGQVRSSGNRLGSVWMRGPAGAVRKLAQAGKIVIRWSITKVEAIGQIPFQCFRCLEIGLVRKTSTF